MPSLRIEELPSYNMNGHTSLNTPPTTGTREVSPSPGLLTPIPNGVRRVSGDINAASNYTPLRPYTSAGNAPSPAESSDLSPSQWSSAVGPAANSGKSGRVIERLMAENDRLKRDLELQILRAAEMEKQLQNFRPQLESLRAENEVLAHARGVDSNLLTRRDRKVEELKVEAKSRGERAEKAEGMLRGLRTEVDEVREGARRSVGEAAEREKCAVVKAEILEQSHKQLSAEYRARYQRMQKDFDYLREEREQDRQRMAKLDVVYEQMRQENEKRGRVQSELLAKWEEVEEAMRGVVEEGEVVNEKVRKKSGEMDVVVNEMRWLMGVAKSGAAGKNGKRKDSKEVA